MSEPRAASGPGTLDALYIAGDLPVCGAASGLPTPSFLFLELAGQRQEACGGRKKGPSATRLPLPASGTREDQSLSGETCIKSGASFVPALRGASLVPALPRAPQLLGTRSGVRSCPRLIHIPGRGVRPRHGRPGGVTDLGRNISALKPARRAKGLGCRGSGSAKVSVGREKGLVAAPARGSSVGRGWNPKKCLPPLRHRPSRQQGAASLTAPADPNCLWGCRLIRLASNMR